MGFRFLPSRLSIIDIRFDIPLIPVRDVFCFRPCDFVGAGGGGGGGSDSSPLHRTILIDVHTHTHTRIDCVFWLEFHPFRSSVIF